MRERMKNPAMQLPKAVEAVGIMVAAIQETGIPWKTMHLVHVRASQVNGCGYCVDSGSRHAKQAGETDQRLLAVAAWRDTPFFTEAERAALELAEAATRLSDRPDPVPDPVWDNARKHYSEKELSGLILWIGVVNLFNRMNVTTRLLAGTLMPWDKAA
jgi:AhpD family alkylhydroperoxidase